jgi:hypothetical protein
MLDGRPRVVIGLPHLLEGGTVPSLEAAVAAMSLGIDELSETSPYIPTVRPVVDTHSDAG